MTEDDQSIYTTFRSRLCGSDEGSLLLLKTLLCHHLYSCESDTEQKTAGHVRLEAGAISHSAIQCPIRLSSLEMLKAPKESFRGPF